VSAASSSVFVFVSPSNSSSSLASVFVVRVAGEGKRCVGLNPVTGRLRREGWEKTNHDGSRGSIFKTYWPGFTLPGSLLVVHPPQILRRARMNRPHPSGKGRGGCVWVAYVLPGGGVDRAHIPREMGGACWRVIGCG